MFHETLGPLLNGPRVFLARVVERSKPAYCIKTKIHIGKSSRPSEKQGSPFRISSPPAGHPTAYEKFVMNKHMKTKNMQNRYLSADDLV